MSSCFEVHLTSTLSAAICQMLIIIPSISSKELKLWSHTQKAALVPGSNDAGVQGKVADTG